jgi:hypothetical protein
MFKKPFVMSVLTLADRLFNQRVSRKRGPAVRLALGLLVACSLLVTPLSVYAQSCEQGGFDLVGPHSAFSYNILWDPNFDQTSCSAWEFDPGTERALTGSLCSGWAPPFARFNGPNPNWVRIKQLTATQWDSQWPFFRFSYTYEIDDPLNNPYTQLSITILDGGVRYSVDDPPGGSEWCHTRHIDLGYHPEWVGKLLLVEIWAFQPGNSTISVTGTALRQSRYSS